MSAHTIVLPPRHTQRTHTRVPVLRHQASDNDNCLVRADIYIYIYYIMHKQTQTHTHTDTHRHTQRHTHTNKITHGVAQAREEGSRLRIAKWLADALVERIQTRDRASLFLNALQSVAAQYSDKQGAVAVHAVFDALSNCGRSSGALRAIWALARMLASLDAASRTTAEAGGQDAANSESAADSLVGAAVRCVRKMAGEATSSSPPPAAPRTGPEN